MTKIFFIAALHLGLRFEYHPEASEMLAQARYDTLEKLVGVASEGIDKQSGGVRITWIDY